jgi:hypothetical protein
MPNSLSAGGQLEQPSDVNNSSRTGTRRSSARESCDCDNTSTVQSKATKMFLKVRTWVITGEFAGISRGVMPPQRNKNQGFV